jgi:dsDNA-binding SOS-regulon protein
MKKTIALMVLATIFMTACQPTPEREVVINKNEGVFEEALKATQTSTPEQKASPTAEPENDNDSERWKDYFEKYDGKLKFTIDAEIITYDAQSYPVAKIKPYYVPIEQANKIIEVLYGTLDVSLATSVKTKDEIQEMISQLELEIKECDKEKEAERYGLMKDSLKELYELLEATPETGENNKYSGEYDVFITDGSEQRSIMLRENSKSLCLYMTINPRKGNGYTLDIEFGNMGREYRAYTDENTGKISFDENPVLKTDEAKDARMAADEFLADIGIENMVLSDMQMRIYNDAAGETNSYAMHYSKVFPGTAIPILSNYGGLASTMDAEYMDVFNPERMMVEIRGDEIIGFEWYSAYEIESILNENIELLPFEEIMANAQSQLAVKYADVNDSDAGTHFYVDKVELSYVVQPIKDTVYEYMLVPAWSFYGGYDYGEGRDFGNGVIKEGRYIFHNSLLSVNAVDGTVISKN